MLTRACTRCYEVNEYMYALFSFCYTYSHLWLLSLNRYVYVTYMLCVECITLCNRIILLVEHNACKSRPCKNGGACTKNDKDYDCDCNADFRGKNCEGETFVEYKTHLTNERCIVASHTEIVWGESIISTFIALKYFFILG